MVLFSNREFSLCGLGLIILLSLHVSLTQAAHDDDEDHGCDDYCDNGGRCRVKDGAKECRCFKVNVTRSDGLRLTGFSGNRCQENIYTCFYERSKSQCLLDLNSVYRKFEDAISHQKYVSACKMLNEVIDCIHESLTHCTDLTGEEDAAAEFENKIKLWKATQDKYCKAEKNAWGDDCCGRNCKKFDKERLCQCNNACRRFNDCCYKKNRLCKWRQANKLDFISSSPDKFCENVDGLPCQKVQLKSNDTMHAIVYMFDDLRDLNQSIHDAVNVSILARKHGYIPKHKPHHHNEEAEIELLKESFKARTESPILLDQHEDCGNCSRAGCANPCPPPACQCEAYPQAVCRSDSCILSPCDSSLPCVARWYVLRDEEYYEVTLSCKETTNDCLL